MAPQVILGASYDVMPFLIVAYVIFMMTGGIIITILECTRKPEAKKKVKRLPLSRTRGGGVNGDNTS